MVFMNYYVRWFSFGIRQLLCRHHSDEEEVAKDGWVGWECLTKIIHLYG